MKKFANCCVSLLLCLTVGCSLFKTSTQTLEVDPDPPKAQVWINTEYAGVAPVKKTLKRNKNVDVVVKKDGYEVGQMTVKSYLNATGILDTIGAWLVILPIIGAMQPGAKSFDEKVVVKLERLPAPPPPAAPTP